jgi:peroxiredoxin
MKINFKYIVYAIVWTLVCYNEKVVAQTPIHNGPATAQEIEKALFVVTHNIDSLGAHTTYIYKMGLTNPLLIPQYRGWIKKNPKSVNIPLAIGTAYYKAEMSQAREFLLKASELEPQNAKIWFMLSADAFNRGQTAVQKQYMEKAATADPSNAGYAYSCLSSSKDENPDLYKLRAMEFVKRFPKDERGAQILYWLGEDAIDIGEKIDYMEELRKIYPPKEYRWSSYGMTTLADSYLQIDPVKALALINTMGDKEDWQIRKGIALQLIKSNEFEKKRNYNEAITELDKIKLPKFNYIDEFVALKKASLQAKTGNIKIAYESLAEKAAKLPTDQLNNALELYGKEMGKDNGQIKDDVKAIRANKAIPAHPFNLSLYTSKDSLNLDDLKGKVVLLTFWFPACGPCRQEFRHFQSVINKLNRKDIAYVGINVFPTQDPYVLPFMKNTKYSFIPLHGSQEFADKAYGVQSEPENFLIDKDGKIIFKNFTINQKNHRTLELMITSLL